MPDIMLDHAIWAAWLRAAEGLLRRIVWPSEPPCPSVRRAGLETLCPTWRRDCGDRVPAVSSAIQGAGRASVGLEEGGQNNWGRKWDERTKQGGGARGWAQRLWGEGCEGERGVPRGAWTGAAEPGPACTCSAHLLEHSRVCIALCTPQQGTRGVVSCAASDKEHAGDTLDTGDPAAGSSEASPSSQGHRESLECQPGAVMRMGIHPANRLLSLRREFTEAGRAHGVSESCLAAGCARGGFHNTFGLGNTLSTPTGTLF